MQRVKISIIHFAWQSRHKTYSSPQCAWLANSSHEFTQLNIERTESSIMKIQYHENSVHAGVTITIFGAYVILITHPLS